MNEIEKSLAACLIEVREGAAEEGENQYLILNV
jgi:hypothetical protein